MGPVVAGHRSGEGGATTDPEGPSRLPAFAGGEEFFDCLMVGGCVETTVEAPSGVSSRTQQSLRGISPQLLRQPLFIGVYARHAARVQHHAAVFFLTSRARRIDTSLRAISNGNIGFPPGGLAEAKLDHSNPVGWSLVGFRGKPTKKRRRRGVREKG